MIYYAYIQTHFIYELEHNDNYANYMKMLITNRKSEREYPE